MVILTRASQRMICETYLSQVKLKIFRNRLRFIAVFRGYNVANLIKLLEQILEKIAIL